MPATLGGESECLGCILIVFCRWPKPFPSLTDPSAKRHFSFIPLRLLVNSTLRTHFSAYHFFIFRRVVPLVKFSCRLWLWHCLGSSSARTSASNPASCSCAGEPAGDGPDTGVPVTSAGDQRGVPGSWLGPWDLVAIWEKNY